MADKKSSVNSDAKTNESTAWYQVYGTVIKNAAGKIIDRVAQVFAAVFFVSTSYGYVSNWLTTHQNHTDLSTAGGILVVSIALYLFVRHKR